MTVGGNINKTLEVSLYRRAIESGHKLLIQDAITEENIGFHL